MGDPPSNRQSVTPRQMSKAKPNLQICAKWVARSASSQLQHVPLVSCPLALNPTQSSALNQYQ
jgi:hypothetical protein